VRVGTAVTIGDANTGEGEGPEVHRTVIAARRKTQMKVEVSLFMMGPPFTFALK
jgi:hypothetical protein